MRTMPTSQASSAFRAIRIVRWTTILLIFLLALVDPFQGRANLSTWSLVLVFAGYNLLLNLLRIRFGWLSSYAHTAVLDLAVAGTLYLLGAEHGGPLYVLIFLAVVCAAATLSLRDSILYVAAASALIIVGESTLYERPSVAEAVRDLGARTIMLMLIAVGTTTIVRRLQVEQEVAREARLETERVAELDRLRTNFVAAVSHELQTPLTAMRAALGLLEASASDRLGFDEKLLVTNARRNVDRLTLEVADLLTLNQLDANSLQLEKLPLDLRATIIDAMAVLHPLAEQKEQKLEVDIDEPLSVEGDRRGLEQVIINLVANAHRHTPAGSRIVISGRNTPNGVLLTISDDGPGIPPHARDRIFERFCQLDPAGGGSGLGLTIVKAIIERHGGHVSIKSADQKKGTTFSVVLPRLNGES